MLHLLKYSFLSKIRNFNIVFWPLVFPLVLGTFFYFAFGNINEADFQTVPVAVVKEASADTFFMTYLDEVEKSSPDLLKAEEMSEKEALEALQDKKVEGIYYVGKEPSLTVAGIGIEESILQTVLDSCENTRTTITNIMKKNPQMDMETMKSLLSSDSLVREVSLGGRTIDGNVQFFYALIAMACLYGCFIGFGSAIGIQANITPLAARRCVTPTHKLKLILTDQLTSFALGYVDVIILILYLRYILNLDFQGQMGKMLVVSFFGSLIGGIYGNVYRQLRKNAGRRQNRAHAWNLYGKQLSCRTDERKYEGYRGKKCSVCEPDQSCITDLRCVLLYQCI